MKIVRMWSGPRNLSTALMRSWDNRSDTEVMDEPLYAHYLATSGVDHPVAAEVIAAGPVALDQALGACANPSLAPPATVSYQKHMAQHLPLNVDLAWLDGLTNCLLLRDPRRVLASYTKVRASVTLDEIGLPQQLVLADRCELIFDSADFLANPEAGLRTICEVINVPFDAAMLVWPAGSRRSDGLWSKHWYASVEASTGFGPPPDLAAPVVLPGHLEALGDEAAQMYAELRSLALPL